MKRGRGASSPDGKGKKVVGGKCAVAALGEKKIGKTQGKGTPAPGERLKIKEISPRRTHHRSATIKGGSVGGTKKKSKRAAEKKKETWPIRNGGVSIVGEESGTKKTGDG